MLRRVLACALVAGSVGAFVFAAPVAQATPRAQSTTCDANLLLRFRPGLTFNTRSQMIRISGSLSNCVGGGVASATVIKGTGSGSISCTSGSASATINLMWNTGEKSQVQGNVDVNGNVTGTVTLGKFAGESVTASLTVTPLNGDCFLNPVTSASATGSVSL